MSPVVCPNCRTKYHDEAKRKYRLLANMLIYSAIVVMLAGFFPKLRHLFNAGLTLGCFAIVVYFIDEIIIVRNGVFTKTTLTHQKKDLKLIFYMVIIFFLGILYELYRAL